MRPSTQRGVQGTEVDPDPRHHGMIPSNSPPRFLGFPFPPFVFAPWAGASFPADFPPRGVAPGYRPALQDGRVVPVPAGDARRPGGSAPFPTPCSVPKAPGTSRRSHPPTPAVAPTLPRARPPRPGIPSRRPLVPSIELRVASTGPGRTSWHRCARSIASTRSRQDLLGAVPLPGERGPLPSEKDGSRHPVRRAWRRRTTRLAGPG
jgi:hypothetical protein